MTKLLDLSGNPQDTLKCIHVAGTNGKGSVCTFLDNIITRAGFVCGKFTSPNLLRVNERICVNGEEISDYDLNNILSELEILALTVKQTEGEAPTQFEIWTAAAFIYFAKKKCDYVVLETGLGGMYDATNLIKSNECAVITSIDFDHMTYLGNTLSEIAEAKCGIIKKGCPVITILQPPEAMAVIEKRATEKHSKLTVVHPPKIAECEDMHEIFSYENINVKSSLAGIYQAENAAIAACTARLLNISDADVKLGIETAVHHARLEKIADAPLTIFDGGHNKAGIRALIASLDRYFPSVKQTVVFACMKDKEIKPSLAALNNGFRKFLFTEVKNNERSMRAADLCKIAAEVGIEGEAFFDLKSAYARAKEYGDMVIICGSLYLYKDLF
ncbi:MAG: folylpolyglutamate synthase/dihydrofolate synthase family protein [Clostridia bacterium]|nr:folylpolyglutamate synthase/dihydrofolate synthase family protein [Clostridia bacterium]